ncbi:hypothetical protein, partial [Xanthomonas sp. GPE 39]|uniref:hypothetical protein n=1 Tax=Xanthomonas sp. GPE 39 TaxID=1583099 RepID=UPI001F39DDCE
LRRLLHPHAWKCNVSTSKFITRSKRNLHLLANEGQYIVNASSLKASPNRLTRSVNAKDTKMCPQNTIATRTDLGCKRTLKIATAMAAIGQRTGWPHLRLT